MILVITGSFAEPKWVKPRKTGKPAVFLVTGGRRLEVRSGEVEVEVFVNPYLVNPWLAIRREPIGNGWRLTEASRPLRSWSLRHRGPRPEAQLDFEAFICKNFAILCELLYTWTIFASSAISHKAFHFLGYGNIYFGLHAAKSEKWPSAIVPSCCLWRFGYLLPVVARIFSRKFWSF